MFNALTRNNVLAENYPFATIEPNTGVVPLPDKRLPVVYYVDGTYTNTLPDAIASPMATAVRSADGRIYDLSGRRITRPLRGIYVQGGRLIVK